MDSKWIIKLQQLKQFDLGVAVGGGVSQQSLVGSPAQIRHTGEVRCNTGGTRQGRGGVQPMLPRAGDVEQQLAPLLCTRAKLLVVSDSL